MSKSKRRAPARRAKPEAPRFRNRRVIAIIAGTAAVAILAVVLVLANSDVPEDDVVATVNGHPITVSDVEHRQARHKMLFDEQIDSDRALELLIDEELAHQQAVPDYSVDRAEAERELEADLDRDDLTLPWLKAQLEESGIVYDDYLETFRRDMVISMYLEDAIAVTEEEAMAGYEQYAREYEMATGMEPPPYEEVRAQIIAELERQNLGILVSRLRQEADIVRYTE